MSYNDIVLDILVEDLVDDVNIAEMLSDEELDTLGRMVVEEFKLDEQSREDYMMRNEDYNKLAAQVVEQKNHPWKGAANVKYPMLTTAAIQFSAHAYPALVNGTRVVKAKVFGRDDDGKKAESAVRVEQHMSYQVLEQMEEWEEDMDRLSVILPIIGCLFKKSYYSTLINRNMSEVVLPKHLVVNYYAANIETAIRKTHIIELTPNDVYEREAAGIFIKCDYGSSGGQSVRNKNRNDAQNEIQGADEPSDKVINTPKVFLEQHRYYDFDGDGYAEPYIFTVEESTGKVVRIVARFDEDGIKRNETTDQIIRIESIEYFTKFGFIPNPDGGIYDLGFGILLGSLNETANTIINQLIDAGTLSNMQSGFISRGIRIRGGNKRFSPGEWKVTNSSGEDLSKGIFPLPVREPSQVLFMLLGTILESGERLAAVKDILVGENPGQNQPATTTLAMLEQGMKVYTAIYKRIHKSLGKEFKKLYRLNRIYLDPEEYYEILDDDSAPPQVIKKTDYEQDGTNVRPYSDPKVSSDVLRKAKANALLELIPLGINREVALKRVLESQDQPNITELMAVVPTPPPFEQTKWEAEFKHQTEVDEETMNIKRMQAESSSTKDEALAMKTAMDTYAAQMQTMREDFLALMQYLTEKATTTENEEKAKGGE